MKKRVLPHGISENMMMIVQIEADARKEGRRYGQQVAEKDLSEFCIPVKKRTPCICVYCSSEIILPSSRHRRVCDECRERRKRESAESGRIRRALGEWQKPEYRVKCSLCGVELIRHSPSRRQKCDDCKAFLNSARRKKKVSCVL